MIVIYDSWHKRRAAWLSANQKLFDGVDYSIMRDGLDVYREIPCVRHTMLACYGLNAAEYEALI